MKTKKTFDCVKMKRRGAERIHEQVAGMTIEDRLSFWRERTESLRERQQAVIARRKSTGD